MNRELKKQQTRENIINVALQLFRTNGYDETDIKTIARHIPISPVTLYKYFPTKYALGSATVIQFGMEKSAINHRILNDTSRSFPEKVHDLLHSNSESTKDKAESYYRFIITFFQNTMTELPSEVNLVENSFWDDIIIQGRQEGYIHPDVSDVMIQIYIDIFIEYFRHPENLQKFNLQGDFARLDKEIDHLFYFGLIGSKINTND